MIYCVWYPSGGFGHFVNAVLSLHGDNFARPTNHRFEFSATGDSHGLDLAAPKYSKDTKEYTFKFDPSVNYSVLVDNGIDNEGQQFKSVFPDSVVYKLCYDDVAWPIVAKTSIVKAQASTVDQELQPGQDWPGQEPWAQREKYFLFLRDHEFRTAWRPTSDCYNLNIGSFVNYGLLKGQLAASGVQLTAFETLHQSWLNHNREYINPVVESLAIIKAVKNNKAYSLSHITDLWDQAVLYYFLWLNYNREVPHNDYADFFKDADEIRAWLN